MKVLEVSLDDMTARGWEALCAHRDRVPEEEFSRLVRRRLNSERAHQALKSPALRALYDELADEDMVMAEAGLAEYAEHLATADEAPTR